MIFWLGYLALLFVALMGVLAAAWSLAVQAFLLSCLLLVGAFVVRRQRQWDKDEYVHWSQDSEARGPNRR